MPSQIGTGLSAPGPFTGEHGSLTTLREKLVKIDAKVAVPIGRGGDAERTVPENPERD